MPMRPPLFRRRSIWLPTIWGGLVALAVALVVAAIAVRDLHDFLAPDAPVGGELLVVEGWMGPDELREVLPLVRSGHYRRIVTTGGEIRPWGERFAESSYAELARGYLIEHGLAAEDVVAVPAPDSAQNRTYLAAVKVRQWAVAQDPPPRRIDVLSVGVHGRRTRRMYALAFGEGVEVGILTAQPADYDVESWWRTSAGAKAVVGEAISWLWDALFFHPPAPGSPEELWGDPETIRSRIDSESGESRAPGAVLGANAQSERAR